MKTHILYIGLVLAILALGALAGPSLLAPRGVATEPQGGKGGIAAPAPPGPAQDLRSQQPKLRHTIKAHVAPADWGERAGYLPVSMMEFRIAFSADGKILVGAQNYAKGKEVTGAVKFWDVATAKERASFPFNSWIREAALTADGKTLAVSGRTDAGQVKLWDVASRKERDLPTWNGSLAFTPDGKTLAVGTAGFKENFHHGVVKLWDVATARERASLKTNGGDYCRVTISPDGKILAAVSGQPPGDPGIGSGAITLWDLPAGQERDTLPESGGFTCVAFTPDGKTLVAGGKGIYLWDLATGQQLAILKAHQGRVASLAFTADGKTLASAAGDSDVVFESSWGEVKLWDMERQRVRAILKGFRFPPSSMAFAPDGRILATYSLGEIKLWDIPVSKQAGR